MSHRSGGTFLVPGLVRSHSAKPASWLGAASIGESIGLRRWRLFFMAVPAVLQSEFWWILLTCEYLFNFLALFFTSFAGIKISNSPLTPAIARYFAPHHWSQAAGLPTTSCSWSSWRAPSRSSAKSGQCTGTNPYKASLNTLKFGSATMLLKVPTN